MKYTAPSFTVPASGKAPADCKHGWVAKNRCVLCGEPMRATPYAVESSSPTVTTEPHDGSYWQGPLGRIYRKALLEVFGTPCE